MLVLTLWDGLTSDAWIKVTGQIYGHMLTTQPTREYSSNPPVPTMGLMEFISTGM